MDILRFCVSGNVDDGKSTLIGRLLFDNGCLTSDQVENLRRHQRENGLDDMDFSIITDGLFDERVQKITIDVAYRYFHSEKRKYIVVDTPGHAALIRNMVSGASVADVSVILVDASVGITDQTKRHCLIASMMGIDTFLFCINKMDLVDFSEARFLELCKEVIDLVTKLQLKHYHFLPVSAVFGDNLTTPSKNMEWYAGATLMEILEGLTLDKELDFAQTRLPVQFSSDNLYFGKLESGEIRLGEEVLLLPSMERKRITNISVAGRNTELASAPVSLCVALESGFNNSQRGAMLVKEEEMPSISSLLSARVIWLANETGQIDTDYILLHSTRDSRAQIQSVNAVLDIENFSTKVLHPKSLETNEIYDVWIHTNRPIFMDPYSVSRATGCFVLCHPESNQTVAAGILLS